MLAQLKKTKGVFFLLFVLLAVLMFGGSQYLGQKVPTARKLEFWRTGIPAQFDYLASQEPELVTDVPTAAAAAGDTAQSLIVLLYHGISESPTADLVGWQHFKDQMFTLKQAGYQTVGLADVEDFLVRGKPLPRKSFLLTFDDGRKDSYYPVDPILAALNYKATIFVITSTIAEDDNFYLSESELKTMVASGRWELGSHGNDIHKSEAIGLTGGTGHALSNKLWLAGQARLEDDTEYQQRITMDLLESKRRLETGFGVTVRAFAYPFGDYGQESITYPTGAETTIQKSAAALFHLAFYQSWGDAIVRNYPGQDTFMVRRLEVVPAWTAGDLLTAVRGGEDKSPDFSTSMDSNPGWIDGWGDLTFSPGRLRLSASPDTTGATSYLDGTYLWKDFDLTVRARLLHGESFSILARVDKNKNFIFCSFGPNGISYGEHINGKTVDGPGWYTDLGLLQGLEIQAGISVKGNTVRCLLNGVWSVESAFLLHTAGNGMIGVSVWGPEKGASELEVVSISAKKID
jgi:peptidoglycan/xylan/chitin deacetylase (PgdA/CDA1 family)